MKRGQKRGYQKFTFDVRAQLNRAAALAETATYRSFYGLGYGAASAAYFLVGLFGEEHPVRKGLRDGAQAAGARKGPEPRRPARAKSRRSAAAPAQG